MQQAGVFFITFSAFFRPPESIPSEADARFFKLWSLRNDDYRPFSHPTPDRVLGIREIRRSGKKTTLRLSVASYEDHAGAERMAKIFRLSREGAASPRLRNIFMLS
jgi:hypothetical protein